MAETPQRDGSTGRGHGPDLRPSVVTYAGHEVKLTKEAHLSGAQEECVFLTTGPSNIGEIRDDQFERPEPFKVLSTCVGKVREPGQKEGAEDAEDDGCERKVWRQSVWGQGAA